MKKSLTLPGNSFKSKIHRFCGLFATAAGVLLFQSAHAYTTVSLPWYEPFAYQCGMLGDETNGNSSYLTPPGVWSADSTFGSAVGSGSPTIFGVCNLSYSGLQTSNNSAGVMIPYTGKTRNCAVLLSTVVASNTPLYTSFLLNVQSLPSGNRLFVALSSVTTGTGPGGSANGIWLSSSGQLMTSVDDTGAAGSAPTSATATTNTTHLVVACYYKKGFNLWLDPATNTFGAAENSVPASNTSVTNSNGKPNVSSFFLISGTAWPQMIAIVDEIRVGTSWASVTPAAAPITPAATQLGFTTQPGYAATGASIGTVTVQVQDQNGNPFASSGVSVNLSLSGNGTLGGTTSKTTDGTGKAVFTNLTVSATGVKQLVASGSLTSGTSDYFSILPGSGGSGSTPVVTNAFRAPGGLVLRGNNGSPNQSFNILASSNITTARSSWTSIGTSTFNADGTFNCTNPVSGSQRFYSISYSGGGGGGSLPTFAMMGWINSNNITGGAGGPTVTVSNYTDFAAYCTYPFPLTVRVLGVITNPFPKTANPYCYIYSNCPNKTFIGIGTNATLQAVDLRPETTNIIIRNIFFKSLNSTNPLDPLNGTNDEITLDGGDNGTNGYTWIDHCDFYNAQDGSCDITKGADYITVSWCRYHYSVAGNPAPDHRLADLIGSSDSSSIQAIEAGHEHVTFHHDWYDTNCMERIPSVRYGCVHVFNNYYACPGNDYCVRTRIMANVLVENTYFNQVNDPFEVYVNSSESVHGLLKQTGNFLTGCTSNYTYILLSDISHDNPGTLISSNATSITFSQGGTYTITNANLGNDTLTGVMATVVPNSGSSPYFYTLDAVTNVPSIVTNYSGAGVILPLP